jgi:hypothetical protein
MRTPLENLEFARKLREFLRRGGRVRIFPPHHRRGWVRRPSQWHLVQPHGIAASAKARRKDGGGKHEAS